MTKILIDEAVVRQALEALETSARNWPSDSVIEAITDLRQALEQPAQEPVACKTLCELCLKRSYNFCANAAKTLPIPTPLAEPDPDELTIAYMSGLHEGKKRKPWVGLTDEEIDRVTDAQWAKSANKPIYAAHRAYARAVEAKLMEKNQ